LRSITALLLFLFCVGNAQAQYTFHKDKLPDEASLIDYATITNTGSRQLSIDEAISQQAQLRFKTMDGKFGNLGFTKDNFWIRFQLKNTLDTPIVYYLHTAEPVTDQVDRNGNCSAAAIISISPRGLLHIEKRYLRLPCMPAKRNLPGYTSKTMEKKTACPLR
jgi:hypothetical protein